ncbi:MAG TPA: DUF6515 family protein, partial [Chitinivibrionales bacterium]|jgi:hypothetical protein|nr:DUF6515 family protein [Chitinivibrionales bacterium]
MNNNRRAKSFRMAAGCLVICLAAGSLTLSVARDRDGFHDNGIHDRGVPAGYAHPHAWGGFYIGPAWFDGPTIVIEGVPYYYYSGIYYTPDGDQLVAVAPPVTSVVAAAPAPSAPAAVASATSNTPATINAKPAQQPGDAITVNVPNTKGGYTAVMLVKSDKGYIGPQGELYPDHPTVDQLKVL